MKALTRHGLISLIVMLSSMPLAASAGEQSGSEPGADRAKTFVSKDQRGGGARREAPSRCFDPYRRWRLHHL